MNNFPRPLGSLDTPPIKYVPKMNIVDSSCYESQDTLAYGRSYLSSVSSIDCHPVLECPVILTSSAYNHSKDEPFKEDDINDLRESLESRAGNHPQRNVELTAYSHVRTPDPDNNPSCVFLWAVRPSLHPDIMYTLSTLRSSPDFMLPSHQLDLEPSSLVSGGTVAPAVPQDIAISPLPFDPQLMPFAARWFKEKSYKRFITSVRVAGLRHFTSATNSTVPVGTYFIEDFESDSLLQELISGCADGSKGPTSGLGLSLNLEMCIRPQYGVHGCSSGVGDLYEIEVSNDEVQVDERL